MISCSPIWIGYSHCAQARRNQLELVVCVSRARVFLQQFSIRFSFFTCLSFVLRRACPFRFSFRHQTPSKVNERELQCKSRHRVVPCSGAVSWEMERARKREIPEQKRHLDYIIILQVKRDGYIHAFIYENGLLHRHRWRWRNKHVDVGDEVMVMATSGERVRDREPQTSQVTTIWWKWRVGVTFLLFNA